MEEETQRHSQDFDDLVDWARLNISRKFERSEKSRRDQLERVERVDSGGTSSTLESPFGSQLTTPVEEEAALDFGYPVVEDMVEDQISHYHALRSARLDPEQWMSKQKVIKAPIPQVLAMQEDKVSVSDTIELPVDGAALMDLPRQDHMPCDLQEDRQESEHASLDGVSTPSEQPDRSKGEKTSECLFDAYEEGGCSSEDDEDDEDIIVYRVRNEQMLPEMGPQVQQSTINHDLHTVESEALVLEASDSPERSTSAEAYAQDHAKIASDDLDSISPDTYADLSSEAACSASQSTTSEESSSGDLYEVYHSESDQYISTFDAILRASGLPESDIITGLPEEDNVVNPSDATIGTGEDVSTRVQPSSSRSLAAATDGHSMHDSGSETSPLLGSPYDHASEVLEVEEQEIEVDSFVSARSAPEEPEIEPDSPPALQLARGAIGPLGILSVQTIVLYTIRAVLFLPWCCLVGGTILLAPNHLRSIGFIPVLTGMPTPSGIRRYQYWATTSSEFCAIFSGAFLSLLWILVMPLPMLRHDLPLSIAYMSSQISGVNVALAVTLLSAAVARGCYAWKGFEVNKDVELGEDDWQSVGLVIWGDTDYLGDYKKGRGLKRTENGGYLACVGDEDEAAVYDAMYEKDVFLED